MDANVLVAVITGGFTSLVAIAALVLNNKRIDDLRGGMNDLRQDIGGLRVAVDLLTGAMHELDKRLMVIEDRLQRKDLI